jgi:hypothetical protein
MCYSLCKSDARTTLHSFFSTLKSNFSEPTKVFAEARSEVMPACIERGGESKQEWIVALPKQELCAGRRDVRQ